MVADGIKNLAKLDRNVFKKTTRKNKTLVNTKGEKRKNRWGEVEQ